MSLIRAYIIISYNSYYYYYSVFFIFVCHFGQILNSHFNYNSSIRIIYYGFIFFRSIWWRNIKYYFLCLWIKSNFNMKLCDEMYNRRSNVHNLIILFQNLKVLSMCYIRIVTHSFNLLNFKMCIIFCIVVLSILLSSQESSFRYISLKLCQ